MRIQILAPERSFFACVYTKMREKNTIDDK